MLPGGSKSITVLSWKGVEPRDKSCTLPLSVIFDLWSDAFSIHTNSFAANHERLKGLVQSTRAWCRSIIGLESFSLKEEPLK